jgi:16S rRNA (cytidine1402-2'-O)-methyltransferase
MPAQQHDQSGSGSQGTGDVDQSKRPPGAASRQDFLASGLYLVATPIGNAQDITLRALHCLRHADVIACEDTRVTARLLSIHGISRPLVSYQDHTEDLMVPGLLARLRQGERVALVSDAGTPLVSDPGFRLVRAAIQEELDVIPIPGASAVLAALCVSGLPPDRFMFVGFLPQRSSPRRRALAEFKAVPATLVFLESAQRLSRSLEDMSQILGDRAAAIGRELTKFFEEVRRGSLAGLADHYRTSGVPKGEVTIVVGPPQAAEPDDQLADGLLIHELAAGRSPRDAAMAVSERTGTNWRRLYPRALRLARQSS